MGPAHPASLTLIHVVTWTVLVSIFLHGLSAGPIGALYGRRMAKAPTGTWELGEADEPQLRHRLDDLEQRGGRRSRPSIVTRRYR